MSRANSLRAAGARKQPDLDLGHADARLVVIRHNSKMTGERELEGPAETRAVNGGYEGLAASLEASVKQREAAHLLEEKARRFFLALALSQLRIVLAEAFEHRKIGPAREALLAGGDDAALDRRVRGDLLDDPQKLLAHLGGDDVHRTSRHVPGRERDAPIIGFEAEIGEVHECLCDFK